MEALNLVPVAEDRGVFLQGNFRRDCLVPGVPTLWINQILIFFGLSPLMSTAFIYKQYKAVY